ncbi:MAG: TldD/PmbA family protein, partial [Gemmatimonadales bacterium]
RARFADAVLKTDETVTLSFESGRLKTTSYAQEQGTNLRVVANGRMGCAGTTADDPAALLEAAFASARLGETVELGLPEPTTLPVVRTHYPRAASASVDDLVRLGRAAMDRLARDGCQVNGIVERSIGSVRVTNSRGADASYDVSSCSISAEVVRVRGDDVLIVSDYLAGADLPELSAVEAMVTALQQKVGWAEQSASAPAGALPVCFTPAGAGALLLPLQQACLGKSVLQGISPLGDRVGTRMFSPGLTLSDDPLLDGRTGSRPVDDEGVPSRPLDLIRDGTVQGFVYDLETAARAGVAPTGHGRRSTFGKPQAAYTNLLIAPGALSTTDLVATIGDGLLVEELLGVGQGNIIGGAFSHPVALAYRVSRGEVVGRVSDVAVSGNAYELLARIRGLGREVKWSGSLAVPPLVIEGVSVTAR